MLLGRIHQFLIAVLAGNYYQPWFRPGLQLDRLGIAAIGGLLPLLFGFNQIGAAPVWLALDSMVSSCGAGMRGVPDGLFVARASLKVGGRASHAGSGYRNSFNLPCPILVRRRAYVEAQAGD